MITHVGKKISHKQYRALLKKQRRKQKRQAAAQLQDANQGAEIVADSSEDNMELGDTEERTEEQRVAHEAWLERERVAQEEFRQRKAKEEAEKQKKLQEQRRIKEEWAAQQEQEQLVKDKKDKELEDVLQQLDKENKPKKDGWPWHNPEPNCQSASTDPKRETCSFFLKTGACRFGERCSRAHPHPAISTTLLFPGMYSSYAIDQSFRDEYDTDIGLEYDEGDAHRNFLEFYEDVLPEFKALGKVVQFKVCCNWEPHLRGNVYVQFTTEEECSKGYTSFCGRYYAGKQLVCQYTPVASWRSAICGKFHFNTCPRGKNCNFLHVFLNPNKEFADADRDFQNDPRSQRFNVWHSQYSSRRRSRERDWRRSRSRDRRYRSRHRSRSRERRRSYSRSRSRSREKRGRSRDRYKRYSRSRSRSRGRGRSRDRERRYSRSRSRSRGRGRSRDQDRRYSRSRSRSRGRGRSRDRDRRYSRSRSRSRGRSTSGDQDRRNSRSHSRGRHSSRSRSVSQERQRTSRSRSKSKGKERKRKRKHRKHSKDGNNKSSKSTDNSIALDKATKINKMNYSESDSDSGNSDGSQRSNSVINGIYDTSSGQKPPAGSSGVYPNLANLIAKDYSLLPADASSEPSTLSTDHRSEPPTPCTAQRSGSEGSEEVSDGDETKYTRSERRYRKKHRHKSKHKSRHKHKKHVSKDVSPVRDN